MAELDTGVSLIQIEDEMKKSYLEYAMSVIVSRALPDARDGLKPVHRRILYAMRELGNEYNRPYKKSARVVGDVMGKYHPHGDSSIYMALVRMAQDFSMRLPLIDGQGNYGSMDGDNPAAMRYTETRMARPSSFLLQDIDRDTVNFMPNYDGHDSEPTVLPARFPNLLVNGTSGIAVGMATNIPPHNLGEMIDATVHLVDNPDTAVESLDEFIKGPDFPTGGIALGLGGIKSAILSGRGSVAVRATTHVEEIRPGKEAIIATEMPYQVNKAKLTERIAELVRDKVIEGISDLRDESDRSGVRLVVELKRDAHSEVVLSQLFKHTSLQSSFSYNMLALDNGRPKLMNMKDILKCFIDHREEVITRRTKYDLRKARHRAHILVGLATAVANIDEVIKIVRNASDPKNAKETLIATKWNASEVMPLIELLGEVAEGTNYMMSEIQAQGILDLKLHRLTGLERDKISNEASEISSYIKELVSILSNRHELLDIMKEELLEVKEMFGTPRKTVISENDAEVDLEDLITPEDMVVTISTDGYVKRQPMSDYRSQRRGGKGKSVTNMKNEEEVETFFVANTHDPLLFFTSIGKVYKLKVYELPLASRGARGKAFINLLPIEKDERVNRVVPIPRNEEDRDGKVLMFATEKGLIRKTPMKAFDNVYITGIKGMALNDGDTLITVCIADEEVGDVLISSRQGKAVRFPIDSLRTIASRTGLGVKGITLKGKDTLMSMDVVNEEETPFILTVTENGYGKRTASPDFPTKSRGTMGVIAIKTSDRNGEVVASIPVDVDDQIMILTTDGQAIRMNVDEVSVIGRNTQGVRLFKTDGAKVAYVSRIQADMLDDDDDEILEGEEGATVEGEVIAVEAATEAVVEEAPTEE
jgi:DNA gyrase subunit A